MQIQAGKKKVEHPSVFIKTSNEKLTETSILKRTNQVL